VAKAAIFVYIELFYKLLWFRTIEAGGIDFKVWLRYGGWKTKKGYRPKSVTP
jgi:hypothetical protein